MKFTRKFTAIILAIVFAMSMMPSTVFAASTPSSWAVESVEEAKTLGVATPELLNDFSATTTRLEFCRAAVNLLRNYGYNVDSVTPRMFADTNDRDIGVAAALGITNGTDAERNLFSPNASLTREQAATLLNNVLGVIGKRITSPTVAWTDALSISSWAAQSANDMYNCGIISGTDSTKLVFSPKTPYTHEQSIVTLLRVWAYISPINDTYNSADYDPANLRQSNNKIVLASDVQSISAAQGVNVLISVDEGKRQYTFDNIDDSIKNLAVGDKFVIYPCTSVPDGVSIIVSAININGNRAIITSTEVSLEDIVESMDISQIIPMTSDMVIEYGDGVTPISSTNAQGVSFSNNRINASTLKPMTVLYASPQMTDIANLTTEIIHLSASGSVTVQPLNLSVDIPINDSIKITGTIAVTPTLKADIDLHEGWFNIPTGVDYFELSLDNKMLSTLRVEALYNGKIVDMASVYRIQDGTLKQKYENFKMTKAKCDAYRQKLFTSAFPIPTAPGLQATVTFYLKVTAAGQISIEAVYTQNNQFGIKLQNGQWSPINTNDSNIAVSGAAEATIYAGVGIDIGLSYIGVVAASVSPEVGIEVKASTEFNEVLLSTSASNKIPHDCVLCIDGDISLKLSLNANVDAIGFGNVLSEQLLSNTTKFGDFYYTLGGSSHGVEFGWSECPYYSTQSATVNNQIVGEYRGTNVAQDGESWIYTLSIFENSNGTLEAIVDCIADTLNNRSNRPGPGAWRSSVNYDASNDTYSIRFKEWIHNPGWAEETYTDCALSSNGNSLTCIQSATTWPGTKNYEFYRVSNSNFSFDYLRPIAQQGEIHFDEWNSSEYRGDFKDKAGKSFAGVGMYVSGGWSGTVYVKYLIPASAKRFTTSISLESDWCGTQEYGTSTFEILFDDAVVYSQSYTETFNAEYIDIPVPQNAKIITLRVQQVNGSRGNHACFFGIPTFNN